MRPAQLTPENLENGDEALRLDVTSMRPAQLTPENRCRPIGRATGSGHFNEAGAINAGKLRLPRTARPFRHNFNEAGAINAGKPAGRRAGDGVPYRTSMRPAQLTPENALGNSKLEHLKGKLQ